MTETDSTYLLKYDVYEIHKTERAYLLILHFSQTRIICEKFI